PSASYASVTSAGFSQFHGLTRRPGGNVSPATLSRYAPLTLLAAPPNLPQWLRRAVPGPHHFALVDVGLELLAHVLGAVDAHAHQPGAAGGDLFGRRDADLFSGAAGDDVAFGHRQVKGAGHLAAPLLAAAKASRAWE